MSRGKVVVFVGSGVAGIAGLAAALLTARAVDVSSKQAEAVTLFEQSHKLGSQLTTYGNTYALLTLLKNGYGIVPNDRYETWCDEMFRLSFGIGNGWDRVAQGKNAVLFWSKVNPDEAIKHFREIENPQPQRDGTYPEDVRSDSAPTIFTNYLNFGKEPQSPIARLSVIEVEAKRLGETGEYPYVAMAQIIKEYLAKTPGPESTSAINRIVQQAVSFYSQRPDKFINRNTQFMEFLKITAKAAPNLDLLPKAANVFVERLLNSPKDMDYQSEVETSKGTTHFNDERKELLFEAFPTIKLVAPALAMQLSQKDPELDKADDESFNLRSGGYNPSGTPSDESELMHNKGLQRNLVKEIANLKDNDLGRAKILAERLTDDAIRIEGYSALMPALMRSNPEEAKQIYFDQLTRLQELTNEEDRLRAMVALSEASYYLHDSKRFSQLTAAVLDQGATLFETDSRLRPQTTLAKRRGFSDLVEMVKFGTQTGLDSLPDQLQKLESVELKTNLLSIEAASIPGLPKPEKANR